MIQELIETLSSEWAIRALVTSSMVGIMCGVIGTFIVLRNMSLIGDALAHAILPGVFFAFLLFGYSTIGFFLGSVGAGLFTAFGITWIQHNIKTKNDAAIGIVYTAMFALGVMGISWISRQEGVHLDLTDFLFGTVLGISNEDIYLTAVVMLYTLGSVILFYRYLFITTFQETIAQTMGVSVKLVHYFLMLLLSFAVVSALRSVGLILVVAMLITPASTALLLSDKLRNVLFIAGFVGLFAAISGLLLSIIFNTNPGPAMAVTVTLIYLLTALLSPKRGLIFRNIRKQRQTLRIETEDILKHGLKTSSSGALNMDLLKEQLGFTQAKLMRLLRYLKREKFITSSGDGLVLTQSGLARANELVRAHRLWETYQVNRMGLTNEQIHEEAENLEHFLTRDILEQVDAALGHPTTDPHGSPIPKASKKVIVLAEADPGQTLRISGMQVDESIESDLWELGLLPNSKVKILRDETDSMIIKSNKSEIRVSSELAKKIKVYR